MPTAAGISIRAIRSRGMRLGRGQQLHQRPDERQAEALAGYLGAVPERMGALRQLRHADLRSRRAVPRLQQQRPARRARMGMVESALCQGPLCNTSSASVAIGVTSNLIILSGSTANLNVLSAPGATLLQRRHGGNGRSRSTIFGRSTAADAERVPRSRPRFPAVSTLRTHRVRRRRNGRARRPHPTLSSTASDSARPESGVR